MPDQIPDNALTLAQLLEKPFCSEWQSLHKSEIIERSRQIMFEAVQSLQLLGSDADDDEREEVIRDAVLRFNDLNEDCNNFIETGEHELICRRLLEIAKAAGLQPQNGLLDDRQW